MFLNVQHITIVIVGDGASTSRFNETFYIAFFVVFVASFRIFFVKNSVAARFAFTFKIIYIIIQSQTNALRQFLIFFKLFQL